MPTARVLATTRTKRILGATLLVLMAAAGAAEAASVSTTGATASNSGRTLTIRDTSADGDNAYANWNNPDDNRIETSKGNGTSVSTTPATLTNFRACRDVSGGLDNCSSYVKP